MVIKYVAEWREPIEQFEKWSEFERDPKRQRILNLFCMLRGGTPIEEASRRSGFPQDRAMLWLSQYRRFGIGKVLGYTSRGRLSIEQQMLLCERSRRKQFESVRDALQWVNQEWGIAYSYNSMRSILQMLELQTDAQLNQIERRPTRWHNSSTELWHSYQNESDNTRRSRLFALYLLRRGIKLDEVTRRVSLDKKTVERFLGKYRERGLEAV
ncbi:MAG: hypothetical protein ACPG8W_15535 [Candidatus Promineifilaceae bacterium]